jgi:hypothetical protein
MVFCINVTFACKNVLPQLCGARSSPQLVYQIIAVFILLFSEKYPPRHTHRQAPHTKKEKDSEREFREEDARALTSSNGY